MEKECTQCTMMVPEESKICPCCGKKFANQDKQGSIIMDTDKKCRYCAYCAMKIPKDAKICPHCRKTLVSVWPAIVIVGVGLFFIFIFIISGKNQTVSKHPPQNAPQAIQNNFNPPQGAISAKKPSEPQKARTAALSADEKVENFVKTALETGVVQKVELGFNTVTILVRPVFYTLDYDEKNATAAAFLRWARTREPDTDLVMLRDSRDLKAIGNYAEGLGLRLEK
ncbi:MAG: hypothetical protein NTW65_05570 [Deltaproteobacteria bacterium]|nr:hypothetical protein [Deltaproteobacteria bacterium]